MNKLIITLAILALAICTFAQERGEGNVAVKGGAFDAKHTKCRTEARTESRRAASGYPNVTFRVIREDR